MVSSSKEDDIISQSALRISFRYGNFKWLINYESLLLSLRIKSYLNLLSPSRKNLIITTWLKNINHNPITLYKNDENTKDIWKEFEIRGECKSNDKQIQVIKVEFEKFPSALQKKNIILRDGYIYLNLHDSYYHDLFILFFVDHFKDKQRELLSILGKLYIEHDFKLNNISSQTSKDDDSIINLKPIETVYDGDVETEHIQYFPLCMKYLHKHLMKYNHLKHRARLQYLLFLKGIGYSLDDSIEFWKSSMCEASYKTNNLTYIIRHAYGKEGHRVEKFPYDCKSIKEFSVTYDSEHGCPFKHRSLSELAETFDEEMIPKAKQKELFSLCMSGNYGDACKLYGNTLYKEDIFKDRITSPNQYYDITVKIHKERERRNYYTVNL